MTKLYRKSPLIFALVWIIVYVVGFSAADKLSDQLGHTKIVTLLLGIVLTTVLLVWLQKQGLFRFYGLTKPVIPAKQMLYYWPLAALAAVNLWPVVFDWITWDVIPRAGAMIFVGILEEVIFRGLLFKAMEKDSRKAAILVSSITFGFGHIVNLLNGAPVFTTLLQIIYATAAGFLFTMIFLKTGSILPCILCHCAVNIVGTLSFAWRSTEIILMALALTVISSVYAWWIITYHPEKS